MGYNRAKELWQTEEALMFSTESRITKMQKTICTMRCTAITTTVIAFIFMVHGAVIAGELISTANVQMLRGLLI
jgi:hypothetical protein